MCLEALRFQGGGVCGEGRINPNIDNISPSVVIDIDRCCCDGFYHLDFSVDFFRLLQGLVCGLV